MPSTLQLRRGNTSQTSVFTGKSGELWVDTDLKLLYLHDGITVGGKLVGNVDNVARTLAQSAYDAANADLSLITSELISNTQFIAAIDASQNNSI